MFFPSGVCTFHMCGEACIVVHHHRLSVSFFLGIILELFLLRSQDATAFERHHACRDCCRNHISQ